MKKETFLILILILMYVSALVAQTDKTNRASFGVEPIIGLQTFGIDGKNELLSIDRINVTIGILLNYGFNEKWGIETGILNLKSGGNFEYTWESINGNILNYNFSAKGNYLSFPIGLSHYWGKNRKWNIDIGFNYNLKISNSQVVVNCLCDFFEDLNNYFGVHLNLGRDIIIRNAVFTWKIGIWSSIKAPFSSIDPTQSLFREYSQKSIIGTIGYKF